MGLAKLRKEAGLSLHKLAKKSGVNYHKIYQIEKGIIKVEHIILDSRQYITRIDLNVIIVGFVGVDAYRYDFRLTDETILRKSSVYALSRDFIVMTSENPGCMASEPRFSDRA